MKVRPLHLRRSWLFVGATNENDIKHSYKSEADVCILEFEDFCAPKERPLGRKNLPKILEDWKKKGGDMVGTPWARTPPNPVALC